MIKTIFSWLTGGGLKAIGEQLNRAHEARLKAKNNTQRIEAEKQIAQLTARQQILLAEQGNRMTRWIRPAIALPIVIYLWKLIIWDKVFGWGATDDLSPELWKLFWIVIGAYFLTRPLEKK